MLFILKTEYFAFKILLNLKNTNNGCSFNSTENFEIKSRVKINNNNIILKVSIRRIVFSSVVRLLYNTIQSTRV